MTLNSFLGLDAGGSSTKWALLDEAGRLSTGRAAPLTSALLMLPAGQQALQDLVQGLPHLPSQICIGMPGLSAGSLRSEEVAQHLAQAFGTLPSAVKVESDLDLAYRTHLAPGQGVLVYAGTGSVAYAVSQNGQVVRSGGRGYRIGDEGGGASIGRSALHWVTEYLDAAQTPTGLLAEQIALITGGLDWETLRAFIYGAPGASTLAQVAPAVTLAAEAGDQNALAILGSAARSLGLLAEKVKRQLEVPRTGPLITIATGGALQSRPLQDALRRMQPEIVIQFRNHAEVAAQTAYRMSII